MFMVIGTFGLVVFMLVLGFIGETVSSLFSSVHDESEVTIVKESHTELATA